MAAACISQMEKILLLGQRLVNRTCMCMCGPGDPSRCFSTRVSGNFINLWHILLRIEHEFVCFSYWVISSSTQHAVNYWSCLQSWVSTVLSRSCWSQRIISTWKWRQLPMPTFQFCHIHGSVLSIGLCQIESWRRILFEKAIVSQVLKNCPLLIETGGSACSGAGQCLLPPVGLNESSL
jgi:hypothetical protein